MNRPPRPVPRPIVVLGSGSRLAAALLAALGDRGRGLDRAACDLTRPDQLAATLHRLRPLGAINCASYNDVDAAEREHERALAVNAAGPAALARLSAEAGWRLLHFSTDYVFGGDALQRPRREDDPPAPVNFYGYSKLLGEREVLRIASGALVVRVAHLFGEPAGHSRPGLASRLLDRARRGERITVTRGQWLTPTAVGPLADAALKLFDAGATGIYHLAGEGHATAEEFARAVLHAAGLDAPLNLVERDDRPATRARDTRLENARLAADGIHLPSWTQSLTDYLVGM